MTPPLSATAFAPASIGNVGVGFDMLGLALQGVGDRITVTRTGASGIRILEIKGNNGGTFPSLPLEASRNTASIAAAALWQAAGAQGGLEMVIRKGIPLQSGMGGSAASAVAAVVASNALLEEPMERRELLRYALEGEKFASGAIHADNIAPSLFGGLVLCTAALLPDVVSISVPAGISSVLLHPHLQVNTAESRRALARSCSMDNWLAQQGYLATFIAGCEHGNYNLLRKSLLDVIIEPQRKHAVPCFDAVQKAALAADAFGCSLSGSGPAMFALCEDKRAGEIAAAMENACRAAGIDCNSWVSSMNSPAACVEEGE